MYIFTKSDITNFKEKRHMLQDVHNHLKKRTQTNYEYKSIKCILPKPILRTRLLKKYWLEKHLIGLKRYTSLSTHDFYIILYCLLYKKKGCINIRYIREELLYIQFDCRKSMVHPTNIYFIQIQFIYHLRLIAMQKIYYTRYIWHIGYDIHQFVFVCMVKRR